MKTIFLSIPYGMSARNILLSDAFNILKKKFQIIILSPLYQDSNFQRDFADTNVIIENLPKDFSFLYKGYRYFLDIIESYYFTQKTKIKTLLNLKLLLKKKHLWIYLIRKTLGIIFGTNTKILELLRNFQIYLLKNRYYLKLFEKFKPNLVFVTHSIALEEFPLAFYARIYKIPVIALIHSWDNITGKSGMRMITSTKPGRMLPIKFDKVIVWNKIMERELIDYYKYSPEDIFVAGIPQFDIYFRHSSLSKKEFFDKMGLDPNRKVILFAAGSYLVLPQECQGKIIEIIVNSMSTNKLFSPCQLLVREHPGTDMSYLENKFKNSPYVFFDKPGVANAALRISKGWQSGKQEQLHLKEVIQYSDITINVCSTMSIDAAVFDKPIICIGFDGYKSHIRYNSILRYYDSTHYKNIMLTGGIKLARSPEELIRYINDYLKDPKIDAEGRKKIREQQCYYLDGKAGERIGNFVSNFIKGLEK